MNTVTSFSEAYEIGYQVADDMLHRAAHPVDRPVTDMDIYRYGEAAASALNIPQEMGRYRSNTNAPGPVSRSEWVAEFEKGYHARLDRYIEVGAVQICQWLRDGEFGVCNAPAQFFEQFQHWGGRQEPAHYGPTSLSEHFRSKNSWIFPAERWQEVTATLIQEYVKEVQTHKEP